MEYPQAIVAIVMLCVCVLLGIPVWWNTTKVYRASLPHSRILQLQNFNVKLNVVIQVFADDSTWLHFEHLGDAFEKYEHFQFNVKRYGANNLGPFPGIDGSSSCDQLLKFEKADTMVYNVYPLIRNEDPFQYYCPSGHSYVLRANSSSIRDSMVLLFQTILPLKQLSNLDSRDVTKSSS